MEKIRFQKYDRHVVLIHLIVLLFILVYIQLPGVQYNKIIFLSLFYLEYKTGQMTPHLTEHLMHAAILTIALWVFAFLTASLSQINRKLYDKEAGARRELATIAQTSATILSSLNVDQILKKIVGGLTGGAGYY